MQHDDADGHDAAPADSPMDGRMDMNAKRSVSCSKRTGSFKGLIFEIV